MTASGYMKHLNLVSIKPAAAQLLTVGPGKQHSRVVGWSEARRKLSKQESNSDRLDGG
jgi:hypothetical protein